MREFYNRNDLSHAGRTMHTVLVLLLLATSFKNLCMHLIIANFVSVASDIEKSNDMYRHLEKLNINNLSRVIQG